MFYLDERGTVMIVNMFLLLVSLCLPDLGKQSESQGFPEPTEVRGNAQLLVSSPSTSPRFRLLHRARSSHETQSLHRAQVP